MGLENPIKTSSGFYSCCALGGLPSGQGGIPMIFIGGGREGLAFGVHAQPTIGCRQWTFGAALAKAKCLSVEGSFGGYCWRGEEGFGIY